MNSSSLQNSKDTLLWNSKTSITILDIFNALIRLLEDLFTIYQSIKIHSEFVEYFIPDRNHPSYYWNVHIYTSLGHSMLVAMTNNTCVKSSIAPQYYKIVSTHAHEISV